MADMKCMKCMKCIDVLGDGFSVDLRSVARQFFEFCVIILQVLAYCAYWVPGRHFRNCGPESYAQ